MPVFSALDTYIKKLAPLDLHSFKFCTLLLEDFPQSSVFIDIDACMFYKIGHILITI